MLGVVVGVGVVATGPGQLRPVGRLVTKVKSILQVGSRLVQVGHSVREKAQKAVHQ